MSEDIPIDTLDNWINNLNEFATISEAEVRQLCNKVYIFISNSLFRRQERF